MIDLTTETAKALTVPEPFGKPSGPGLWHVKGMQLPHYVQHLAHDLLDGGHAKTESQAIAMAYGIIKKWAKGIPVGGERKVGGKKRKHPGHIHPDVQAAAASTVAEWEAKRARAHAQHAAHEHSGGGSMVDTVDLAQRKLRLTPETAMGHSSQVDVAARRAQLQAKGGEGGSVQRELAGHRASRFGGAAAIRQRLTAHLHQVHRLTGHFGHMKNIELHALHAQQHASGKSSMHSHHPSIALNRTHTSNLSNVSIRFDAWGHTLERTPPPMDLAIYATVDEEGDTPSEYDLQDAERRLGPDHPHTKRLRARLQKHDQLQGALRERYADHMAQVHRRGDVKSAALDTLQREHAQDHREHPGMRHGHHADMTPNGVKLEYMPSQTSMAYSVQHYDVWGKAIDLAPPGHTSPGMHIHTTKAQRKAGLGQLPRGGGSALGKKSALVAHLRGAHGLSGSHEAKSLQSLRGVHQRDHAARSGLSHSHRGLTMGSGSGPMGLADGNSKVSFDLAAARKGKDPIDNMDEAAIKKAWAKLKRLPPGLQAHMRARLLARAKKLGIALARPASNGVDLAAGKKPKKKGEYVGFQKLVDRLMAQGKSEEEAKAIAASIGRAKYGAAKFQSMAARGQKGG